MSYKVICHTCGKELHFNDEMRAIQVKAVHRFADHDCEIKEKEGGINRPHRRRGE